MALAMVYLLIHSRRGQSDFAWTDAMILIAIMAIGTVGGARVLDSLGQGAQQAALAENLRLLRTRIELYRMEHGGQPPVLFKGGFPQLTHPTNAQGVPGPAGKDYPLGPYFLTDLPSNPLTGSREVNPCEEFPPNRATGRGGWLYHQATGRIAPDVEGYLQE